MIPGGGSLLYFNRSEEGYMKILETVSRSLNSNAVVNKGAIWKFDLRSIGDIRWHGWVVIICQLHQSCVFVIL